MTRKHFLFATTPAVANGGQGYYPEDIRSLYNIPADLDGEGQTIGILEFSNGYNMNDATQFWQQHNITPPNVVFVSVDGTQNDNGTDPSDEEASLDLQWAGAIAPKAQIVVYEANAGNTYATFADAVIRVLKYILNDTQYKPSVLSISYGDAEVTFGNTVVQEWASLIEQLDAKGITVCISSGDQGAYGMHDLNGELVAHADAPASAPFAVAVGGTSLQPDGTETAWTYNDPENGGATGGGFSSIFARPAYQNGLGGATRGLPDIALNADPATGYQIIFQGNSLVVGGTSVSAPVFAAIVALTNQQLAKEGLPPLTNLTSRLYEQSAKIPFKDITVGNNTFNNVQGYQAGPGWDACTGWGSLDVAAFINYIAVNQPATSQPVRQPMPPLPGRYPVVRVQAMIQRVEPDVRVHGVSHQHLLIENIQVLDIAGADPSVVADRAFCAIRFGDSLGLPGPIPDLQQGNPIELQGEYIDQNHAYPSIGNPGDPVIHFTHHPVGFVIYEGKKYE